MAHLRVLPVTCNLLVLSIIVIVAMSSFPRASAQGCTANGSAVNVTGFLMDNFCIDRGTLFDNPTVRSLEHPEVHTIHCLLDVPDCVASQYAILAPPVTPGSNYSVKYQLGEAGSALAVAAAEAARKAGEVKGLQLVVAGIDDGTQDLKCVSSIKSASAASVIPQGCTANGSAVTATGFLMDNFCIDRGTLFDNPTVKSLEHPEVHTIHCLVDVPDCVASQYAILAPPATPGGMYSVKYQLGEAGSALAVKAAAEARKAGEVKGLQLTVTGIDDGTTELKCVTSIVSTGSNASANMTSTGSPSPAPKNSAPDNSAPLLSSFLFAALAVCASLIA